MTELKTISVVLADDHPIVRGGCAALLEMEPSLSIVGQAEDGIQALAMIRELRPDVVIVDLGMPTLNGMEVIRYVRRFDTHVRIGVLSISEDPKEIKEAFRLGANGYVSKQSPATQLVEAIHVMMKGGTFIPEAVQSPRLAAPLRFP